MNAPNSPRAARDSWRDGMNKKTLRFAYWINAQIDGEPPEWCACYYLQVGEGVTQIDANKALARGYLLDPETPTLKTWKHEHEK